MIVYQNLSSGGILSIIRSRIEESPSTNFILYFMADRGGAQRLKGLNNVSTFVGKNDHLKHITNLIIEKNISRVILFSHYHLVGKLINFPIDIEVEFHFSDEMSLSKLVEFVPTDVNVCVPSDWSRRFVLSMGKRLLSVKTNTVNREIFFTSDASCVAPTTPEYIYIGQLGFHKGLEFCMAGFARFVRIVGPRVLHVVISADIQKSDAVRLLERAEGYGIENEFNFYTGISGKEVALLLRKCAVSGGANIVASRRESFGLAVAEAQACGLNSVVANVAALPELVEEGDILYDHGDISELASALSIIDSRGMLK